MRRAFVAAVCLLSFLTGASAQDQGFTANLGGRDQQGVPNNAYTLLRFTEIAYDTFPKGSVVIAEDDFAFVAPRDGLVRFSGQVWSILDRFKPGPTDAIYAVKISKNAPCGAGDVFTGIGNTAGGANWWRNAIPVDGEDLAAAGDTYRWCIYATSGEDRTSYVDGNRAHTVIHVSMPAP